MTASAGDHALRDPSVRPPRRLDGAGRPVPQTAGCSARPLAVLVVESHADCAETLAMLLALYGHSATVAATYDAAVRSAASFPPDVVVTELRLAGGDGCDLVRRLRVSSVVPPFIVALTTGGRAEDIRRSAEAGVDLHLVKPIDPRELQAVLADYAAGRPLRPPLPPGDGPTDHLPGA